MDLHGWFGGFVDPKHVEAWISGIAGAGGAVLGGLVTVWVAKTEKRRERKQKMAAATFAAHLKISKIYSFAIQYKNHLAEGLEASKRTPDQPICTRVRPMNRLSSLVEFSTDEHWSMMQLGGTDLHQKVVMLDASFNTIIDMMDLYREMRDAAWEKFDPKEANGLTGVLMHDGQLPVKQKLELAVLDDIITSIFEIASGVMNDAFSALETLIEKGGRHLGDDVQLEIPNPQGTMVTLYANPKSRAKAARNAPTKRPFTNS
jgi:hypothetical protein